MLQHGVGWDAAAVYIWGDVTIASDVAIAPGAVLEAAPGSRLIIRERVCIGSGAIIQVPWGELLLDVGVTLGTGVLVWGCGTLGAHACIGSESTLLNPEVEAGQVIAPRSLLGTPQTQAPLTVALGAATVPEFNPPATSGANQQNGSSGLSDLSENGIAQPAIIYGRDQVTQLIQTLFPHRQPLDFAPSPENSPTQSNS